MNEELVRVLLTAGPLGVAVLIAIIVILNPDKASTWAEILWAGLSRFWRGADRKSVQLGLQGRMNQFASLAAKQSGQRPTKVQIEWTGPQAEPGHFFSEDRLVIRLHSHERQDRNLVTASIVFVSETLVRRAKRFLSKRQARSVDLFAVDRLLTMFAPPACELFHEEVMGPEADADGELRDLIVSYHLMERAKVFFPVFVRELNYLGQKVIVKPRDERLITDTKGLIGFLTRYADRTVGQKIPMEMRGQVLRCSIMIVALRAKRETGDIGPFVNRLRTLQRAGYETIYLVGSAERENRAFMDQIAQTFRKESGWREIDRRVYRATLRHRDGSEPAIQAMLIGVRTSQAAEIIEELEPVAPVSELHEVAGQ